MMDRKGFTFLKVGYVHETLSFGEWLRHRRRDLDLTQEELGNQVGCARITIRKIEANQMRPSRQLAESLVERMGVPFGERERFIHFAREGELPELVAAANPKHNLPKPISSFIGREREITETLQGMDSSRLVTLTGAGGSGKTRLSIEVGRRALDRFPDGVWFIGFAPLGEATLVLPRIATALRVRENPDCPLIQALIDSLGSKQLLLIFDNCEHLIAECSQTAEKLLQACPQLSILATSREALNILGERQYYVPTLSLPDPKKAALPDQLMQSEAVQLFMERARDIRTDFALTIENAAAVAQICQQLDGIPLALELAAALVKYLSVDQIASRLSDRFHLLTEGSRTALPRQRTLQATIDWSYNLLPAEERVLLRRLSIFSGGWTLQAAESVCTGNGLASDQILDVQRRLIDKSLLVVVPGSFEPRYHMLKTIRQYAWQKLEESNEARELHARHLAFFVAWGEQAELGVRDKNFRSWVNRIEKESDNLRTALRYAIDSNCSEFALRLIGATFWIWWARWPWSEGQTWAETALSKASSLPTAPRAKTLLALALFLFSQADYSKARQLLNQSISIWQSLEYSWWCTFATLMLGVTLHRENNPGAHSLLQDAADMARELNDRWLLAMCLRFLGQYEFYQGNIAAGRAITEESLALIYALGDHTIRGDVLCQLGEIADAQRDYSNALRWYQESLLLARETGNMDLVVNVEFDMGRVFQISGENDQAARLFIDVLQESLHIGKKSMVTRALLGLAVMAQARGDSERAIRLFSAGDSLYENLNSKTILHPMDRAWLDEHIAAARAQLGEDKFCAISEEGKAMTLDQAVNYALEAKVDLPSAMV